MATIYYWDMKPEDGSWGHISIYFHRSRRYISHFPRRRSVFKKKGMNHEHTYADDWKIMGRDSTVNLSIPMSILDESRCYDWWHEFKNSSENYNFFTQNCAHIVLKTLNLCLVDPVLERLDDQSRRALQPTCSVGLTPSTVEQALRRLLQNVILCERNFKVEPDNVLYKFIQNLTRDIRLWMEEATVSSNSRPERTLVLTDLDPEVEDNPKAARLICFHSYAVFSWSAHGLNFNLKSGDWDGKANTKALLTVSINNHQSTNENPHETSKSDVALLETDPLFSQEVELSEYYVELNYKQELTAKLERLLLLVPLRQEFLGGVYVTSKKSWGQEFFLNSMFTTYMGLAMFFINPVELNPTRGTDLSEAIFPTLSLFFKYEKHFYYLWRVSHKKRETGGWTPSHGNRKTREKLKKLYPWFW